MSSYFSVSIHFTFSELIFHFTERRQIMSEKLSLLGCRIFHFASAFVTSSSASRLRHLQLCEASAIRHRIRDWAHTAQQQ